MEPENLNEAVKILRERVKLEKILKELKGMGIQCDIVGGRIKL